MLGMLSANALSFGARWRPADSGSSFTYDAKLELEREPRMCGLEQVIEQLAKAQKIQRRKARAYI